MPGLINTRPQAINLNYYPGQTILLTFTFPSGYLATRVLRSFLGGRATPGVELTVTETSATVLTVAADASDTAAFDFPIEWELDVYDSPTYTPIFVGTWAPGTDGPTAPTTASYVVRTPDELAVTVTQSSPPGVGGVNGNTVLNGAGVPTTEGVDGDFYIDTDDLFIYGPKAAGVWGAGQALATGPAGPAGSVSDGDKGDITVTSSGTVWTIDAAAVTLAKIANIATARILGRTTAGSGVTEELTGAQALAIAGGIAASNLTANGDIQTRAAGVPAPITRANLAADPAFSGLYAPLASGQLYRAVPAGNLTRTSTTLGALSTPLTLAVTAAASQRVRLGAFLAIKNSTDDVLYAAFAKGGTVIFKTSLLYANGGALNSRVTPHFITFTDDSPSVGSNTYEVYVASGGGTLTVCQDATLNTTISNSTGMSEFTAQVFGDI